MPAPRRPTTTAFEPVSLADLEVAERIAKLSSSAEPRQRVVPVEQLLAAFGEREATPEAVDRVRSALRMAGIVTSPDIATAQPGTRVELRSPRRGAAAAAGGALAGAIAGLRGGKPPGPLPVPVAIALLAGVLLVFVLLAGALSGDEPEGERLASTELPRSTATATTPATTATTPAAATTDGAPAETGPSAEEREAAEAEAEAEAAEARRRAKARRERERRARERAARARAQRKSFVGLRLVPRDPGYVCVVGPNRKVLYDGILDEPRVFKERALRVVVEGPRIRVSVDGDLVSVKKSPEGFLFGLERRTRISANVRGCDGPPQRGAFVPPAPGTVQGTTGAGTTGRTATSPRVFAPAPAPAPAPPRRASPLPAQQPDERGTADPRRPPPGDATGGG